MKAEITFDLVMDEDMSFAEGCYRILGQDWQVFTSWKSRGRWEPGIRTNVTWKSGVTGMNWIVPDKIKLNKESIIKTLSEALGVVEWVEVRGPDSMRLR